MNVKQLKSELKNLDIAFPSKAKKVELEALLAAASPSDEPVEVPRKKRTSTKAILRALFAKVGDELTVEDVTAHVVAQANVKPETIGTMIGDLKNPKYAAGEPVFIERKDNVYRRVDAPAS
jgi:hypothetical protein